MTPTINMERRARSRAGLLSIGFGVISGVRLVASRLALHRMKRQKTNTQKALGDMESTVTPSRGISDHSLNVRPDPTPNQMSRSQTNEATTRADRLEQLEFGRTSHLYAFRVDHPPTTHAVATSCQMYTCRQVRA